MADILNHFSVSFKNPYFVLHLSAIFLSYVVFLIASLAALLYLIQDNNLKKKEWGVMAIRLPDLSVLDRINYRFIGLGFPLLTLAIISGYLWAKEARGVYWGWNPREVASLALWFLYAIILHVRLSSKMRGKKVALLSILAFLVIIITLLDSCRGIR